MSLMEISNARAPAICERDVECAVENQIAAELRHERNVFARQCGDVQTYRQVLVDFIDWCESYRLPNTAHMMAAYLCELHHSHGASSAELEEIAGAYLAEHAFTVRVPVLAAMRHCASTAPRAIADHHTKH